MNPDNQSNPQPLPQNPSAVPPPPSENIHQSSTLTWLLIVLTIVLLIVAATAAYLFMTKPSPQPSHQQSTYQQPQSTTGVPQIKVTDLAPGVPDADKTIILVQHSDSSQEKVIIKTDLAAEYIKSLPEGERALSQTPAGK